MKKIQAYAIFEKKPKYKIPIPSCKLKNSDESVWSVFSNETAAKIVIEDYKAHQKKKGKKAFAVEVKPITISYQEGPIIKKVIKK